MLGWPQLCCPGPLSLLPRILASLPSLPASPCPGASPLQCQWWPLHWPVQTPGGGGDQGHQEAELLDTRASTPHQPTSNDIPFAVYSSQTLITNHLFSPIQLSTSSRAIWEEIHSFVRKYQKTFLLDFQSPLQCWCRCALD